MLVGRLPLLLLLLLCTVGRAQRICEKGWLYVNEKCWLYTNELQSWQQAEQACDSKKSDLAIISNDAENRFLYSMIQKYGIAEVTPGTGILAYRATRYANILARNPRLLNILQLSNDEVPDLSCFSRVPDAALLGYAEAVIPAASVEECLTECLHAESTYFFECNSLMYYPQTDECILNVQTRHTQKLLFTKDVGDESVDYYDNNCRVSDAERAELDRDVRQSDVRSCFEEYPQKALLGFATVVRDGLDIDACLDGCLTDLPGCSSVVYYGNDVPTSCIMNLQTKDTHPELFADDPDGSYWHFVGNCDAPPPRPATTQRPRPGPNPGPTTPGNCDDIVDLVMVVDSSGSIGARDYQNVRTFLRLLAESFEISPDRAQVALVQFTDMPVSEFHLGTYQTKEQVTAAIDRTGWRNGHTRVGQALQHVLDQELTHLHGDRANVHNIVVVLTDGMSQDDPRPQAQQLTARGSTLYAIGVTEAVHDQQLMQIAGSEERVFKIADFTRLDQRLRDSMMQQICSNIPRAQVGAGVWLGLNKRGKRDFEWTDGSRLSYTNWKFGQPDAVVEGQEDCVISEFEPLQRWSDVSCERRQAFVCVKEPQDSLRNRILLAKHRDASRTAIVLHARQRQQVRGVALSTYTRHQ